MNWSKWIRQTHRWLSIAFTVGLIVNFVAVNLGKYTNRVGLWALVPLFLQLFPVCTCSCCRMPPSGAARDALPEAAARRTALPE